MKQIVFASSNIGKLQEFQQALPEYWLRSQNEFECLEAIEDGMTFVENALIKARNAAKYIALPAIADDSGIVIPSLQGKPGIYSSRYAGIGASNYDNIQKVLGEMKDITNRAAYFYAAVVYLQHEYDSTPIIAIGKWHGVLLDEMRGEGGFGYDPIFYLPELKKTSAELSISEKNVYSHRGQAIKQLVQMLQ